MTNEEAIRTLEPINDYSYQCGDNQTMEALNKAIEALEKQIPKKPNIASTKLIGGEVLAHYNVCPICDEVIMSGYPCKCGQMIDWEDDNGSN